MKTCPIMLKLQGRHAVVIGSGPVALRRARILVEAGASVTLVTLDSSAEALDGCTVRTEAYRPEFIDQADIVFACTDDREVNHSIAADARARKIWVNTADQIDDCDFYAAATRNRGGVVLAVGTDGAAPGVVAWLADHLAQALPDKIGPFIQAIEACRERLRVEVSDEHRRMAIMRRLSSRNVYEDFLFRGPAAIDERLSAELHAQSEDD
jgi:siroheme synthase-like protein